MVWPGVATVPLTVDLLTSNIERAYDPALPQKLFAACPEVNGEVSGEEQLQPISK